MAKRNLCPKCRKKTLKNSTYKKSRKSKKQKGGNNIVYVEGTNIPANPPYDGLNISSQMAYLSKKCGSK
jgi:hypothetical protein